jgi:hypothetical protein
LLHVCSAVVPFPHNLNVVRVPSQALLKATPQLECLTLADACRLQEVVGELPEACPLLQVYVHSIKEHNLYRSSTLNVSSQFFTISLQDTMEPGPRFASFNTFGVCLSCNGL